MHIIQAPQPYQGDLPTLFLAGGISDTQPWQDEVIRLLSSHPGVLLNPRRVEFPMGDVVAGEQQIRWEFQHLSQSSAVAFWFPPETLCPIALFELGACCSSNVTLFVGAHRDYARRFDLEIQLRLRRPEVRLVDSLVALSEQIRASSDRCLM